VVVEVLAVAILIAVVTALVAVIAHSAVAPVAVVIAKKTTMTN
jgi:hypothetical protein